VTAVRTDLAFVCFAAQDWWYHSRAHSEVQLMVRLARRHPVLLVNSIGMRLPLPGRSTQPLRRVARKLASLRRGLRRIEPDRLWVLSPVSLPVPERPRLQSANAAMVRAQVARAMRRAGISDPVIVVTIPTAWDVVAPMARRALLYNRADRHSAMPGVDRTAVGGREQALLRCADRVLYASRAFMREEASLVGERGVFLDHGVDLDHFRLDVAGGEPPDLASIPRPRVGFFGTLDEYTVDVALLERVALAVPEAQLVLIGDATVPLDRLRSLPNVHHLGPRPYAEIPRYGRGFDVALMPWLGNDWIRAANPIKLKEYLALGLPVVSTDYPDVHRYRHVVTVAPSADAFVDAVRARLADRGPGTPAARRAAVAGATWDARARELEAVVADLLAPRAAG
jgi:glycosyltransferase involved in cell wall biosynthesis